MITEEDKHVLDACEEWLQQAESLVEEADTKIETIMRSDGGSLLAEEWVTFVHKYSMQIRDIEQVRLVSTLLPVNTEPTHVQPLLLAKVIQSKLLRLYHGRYQVSCVRHTVSLLLLHRKSYCG